MLGWCGTVVKLLQFGKPGWRHSATKHASVVTMLRLPTLEVVVLQLSNGTCDNPDTTSDCCQIDVRRWQRDGLLQAGQCFARQWTRDSEVLTAINVRTEADHLILSHWRPSYDASCADLEYAVRLEWTSCHYGGTRAWFLCPARGCGRRVAILYLGGAFFACRHCYQLGYQSQREAPYLRAIYRAQAIRIKLGGSADLNMPFPWLLVNLDRHKFRDAPGISQRVGDVFSCQLAHDKRQVTFESCFNRASINPLDVFCRASTANHFHQEFCILHSLLYCLGGSAERESLHR